MAHDIFISYSTKDKAVADAICATLEGRKIRCWIAPRDTLPGIPYAEALINGINNSRILVLVFSANSNDSPQVMREVERAVNKGIPIVPFRIENVMPSKSMEYFLSAPHWLDALTPPLEKHLQRLAETIQILLAQIDKSSNDVDKYVKPEPKKGNRQVKRSVLITSGIASIIISVVGVLYLSGIFGEKSDTTDIFSKPISDSTQTTTLVPSPEGDSTASVNPIQVLFEDNFTDPSSGWITRTDNMAEFSYDQGEFDIVIVQDQIKTWTYNYKIGELTDCIIQVDAKPVRVTDQDNFGIVFRWQEPLAEENIYYFGITTDGYYAIMKKENFVWYPLCDWTASLYIHKGFSTNQLKIVCNGSQFSVYVNETLLSTVEDASFGKGWLGLSVSAYTSPAQVRFDNLKIFETK